MADINARLERLSRREELGRRARQRALPANVAGVGADFLEIVEAVAQVVRRHPRMSIMLAPGDGRPGSAVIRVTERDGEAEAATVTLPGGPTGSRATAEPPEPVRPPQSVGPGRVGEPEPASPRMDTWRPPRSVW